MFNRRTSAEWLPDALGSEERAGRGRSMDGVEYTVWYKTGDYARGDTPKEPVQMLIE